MTYVDHTGLEQQLLGTGDPHGYITSAIQSDPTNGNVLAVALYAVKGGKTDISAALRTQFPGTDTLAQLLATDPCGRDTTTMNADGVTPHTLDVLNKSGVSASDMPSPSDVQRYRWLIEADPLPTDHTFVGDQVYFNGMPV